MERKFLVINSVENARIFREVFLFIFRKYLKITLFHSLRKVLRIQTGSFGGPVLNPILKRNADRQKV